MKRKDVELQFVLWNFAGAGSDRLTSGNWKFCKDILYYNDHAYRRVVHDSKSPIMLERELRSSEIIMTEPKQFNNHSIVYRVWDVPTVGVNSRHAGDWLSPAELHERQRYLMIAEMKALIEEMIMPAEIAALDKQLGTKIIARASLMQARYFNYGLIFGTKWGEMPRMYMQDIKDAIRSKLARYHDPKAVAQRERDNARRIAKLAFGLPASKPR